MLIRIVRIAVAAAVVLVLAVATYAFIQQPRPAQVTASSVGGPFTLIDQNGQAITEQTYKGKPFLVFFGFTHCPDICPTTLYEISQVFAQMGGDADKIRALFVTVDPARDTPEQLKLYMTSFDKHITGLSGDQAAIDAMIGHYKAYAKRVDQGGGSYTMDHTAVVYIMDKEGNFAAPLNLKRPPEEAANELRKYL
jgi:protein SCO1